MAEAIRLLVASEHGVALSTICLIKTRTIPKTTSGKIARSWCRKALLEGKLQILYRWDTPVTSSSSAGGGSGGSAQDALVVSEGGLEEVSLETEVERTQAAAAKSAAAKELRALEIPEILQKLENLLVQIR